MIPFRFLRSGLVAAPAVFLAGIALAHADSDSDHGRARDAVRSGEVLPLAEILERLNGKLGGDVIEVEFERENGRYIYEFEIVRPDGRVQEIYVDAKTAAIIARKED